MKRFITSVVILLGVGSAVNAESQKPVKGTHIIVPAPSGFVVADRFPGYMSEETGSSVMVSELPAPFAKVTKDFGATNFKKQGMTLLTKEDATYGSYKGVLISASQSARGVDFLKWMGVFGDEKTTYMVTASFPKEAEDELSDVLKKSVIGARVSATCADPLGDLTFRVSSTGDMRIAKVFGNNILLSKDGVFPAKGIGTPIMVIGASASKGLSIQGRRAFVAARLQEIATLRDVLPKATDPVTIDGLDGFESVANATDTDSGTPALIYQVVLFDADGYYAIQGIASEQDGKTHLPTFKQIARTFTKSKAQHRGGSDVDKPRASP
ncbi:MAG: hypothetical protein ABFC77_08265 [Thermoguttaceae bacterium]